METVLACLAAAGGGYLGGVLFADPERTWWAVRDAIVGRVFTAVGRVFGREVR
jgi:hypothetical protein